MSSIFVQLPSYHDYELPETINDIINKSSGKHNINIGLYLCYYNKDDIRIPNIKNLKIKKEKSPQGIGIGYSRLQAHNFYNGEDYYLQIDSHSKMNLNWDEQVIADIEYYKKIGFEKPLITNYPRNYWYKDDGSFELDQNDWISQISFNENKRQFKDIRIPTQKAVPNIEGNIFSNSVSGGSIFALGEFIVPNPKIAFYGEEIFTAARAFTEGYDLLLPRKQFMYHLYFDHNRPKESKRNLIWKDWGSYFEEIDKISKEEIYKTFTENIIGPGYLGQKRTLEEYGQRIGLDFKLGEVLENC